MDSNIKKLFARARDIYDNFNEQPKNIKISYLWIYKFACQILQFVEG